MKITQIATGGILLLLVAAGFLMLDSANDKKFAQLQDKQNELLEQIAKMKQPAPAPAPTPAVVEVAPASTAVAAAPKDLPAAPKGIDPTKPAADPTLDLPNPTADLKLAAAEQEILDAQMKQVDANLGVANNYNALQVKIKNLPVVARIKNYDEKHGFVELDAGKNRQLETGMVFDVRRDAVLVGKVKIGETVEEAVSIADVDPKSVPLGVVLKKGDEIVLLN